MIIFYIVRMNCDTKKGPTLIYAKKLKKPAKFRQISKLFDENADQMKKHDPKF